VAHDIFRLGKVAHGKDDVEHHWDRWQGERRRLDKACDGTHLRGTFITRTIVIFSKSVSLMKLLCKTYCVYFMDPCNFHSRYFIMWIVNETNLKFIQVRLGNLGTSVTWYSKRTEVNDTQSNTTINEFSHLTFLKHHAQNKIYTYTMYELQ
jgi:hypothetical protein